MRNLIEQLRGVDRHGDDPSVPPGLTNLTRAAADRIAKLEVDNARLQGIIRQVDDVLMLSEIIAKNDDYKKALHELVTWEIQVFNDLRIGVSEKEPL